MDNDNPGVAAAVVLAAGGGTRMKSSRSKVLHEVCGRTMLDRALDAVEGLGPQRTVVVVGHRREQVEEHLAALPFAIETAFQAEQRGTGHAVAVALEQLGELSGEVIVTYADVPLLSSHTLEAMLSQHRQYGDQVTVLTAQVPDPTGYGRILRDEAGHVQGIVEHKDADEEQLLINEINSGILLFDAVALREGLSHLDTNNAQGELYLTDVLGIARERGNRVGAYTTTDLWQTEGVNDRAQLARMNAEQNRRLCHHWMREGVTILDPATTWIHESVTLEEDVTLLPNTHLEGATSIGAGSVIGPEVTLTDVGVGRDCRIVRSHVLLSEIGDGAEVGPYAYLRPGSQLGSQAKVGTFVETKNSEIGDGAKVPHQSYVGDATIGAGVNIGAGVIFANYDGVSKHRTTVGEGAFVGSNSTLVAPLEIADGSFVAGGSAITDAVGAGELAIGRARQRNIPDWVERNRPDTVTGRVARDQAPGTPQQSTAQQDDASSAAREEDQ
ncbi:bifunctional UDP-N-acetylglucosamine diphosphorylase/glucosamine-1-phosphate N-acetyltransferase GlmU [Parenemella sanctibonifatiensis]|nr:bifunctional UDP-N-acetylglucosamine diphosphorylase/glucosamine-1-phosphate N-acetyltransferase GlmU [Parenemella sanctibonifatiensis]